MRFLVYLIFAALATCLPCAQTHAAGEIEFTRVPAYGSSAKLLGQAWGVNFKHYRVAVYIYVGGWWTKPYWDQPEVFIGISGRWGCDITTGGSDKYATEIIAFLVPRTYDTPLAGGGSSLEAELYDFPYVKINRDPAYRRINFAGYRWWVLQSQWPIGAGPNFFTGDPNHVYVDSNGYLHMNILKIGSDWYCSEIVAEKSFGYGTYVFTVDSRVELLDENIVVGLFTWENDVPQYNYREIDIEFSRWTDPLIDCGQYVVQPWDIPGNMYRFDVDSPGTTTHEITWQPDEVNFISYYEDYNQNSAPQDIIASWAYDGDSIPPAGAENPRINFWLVRGQPPADGQDAQIVIKDFQFIPNLTMAVQKYKVKMGRNTGQDSIRLWGTLGKLNTAILERADNIEITIDSEGMAEPLVVEWPISGNTLRNGKYNHRDGTTRFRLDISKRKFYFSAKKVDLTGLACPISLGISLGNCTAEASVCD